MKNQRITFRLTEDEYKLFKMSHKKSGISMTSFLRLILFKKIKELPSKEASDIQRLFLFEYSMVGKNINQIAKALNTIAKNNQNVVFSAEQVHVIKSLEAMIERWDKLVRETSVINKNK